MRKIFKIFLYLFFLALVMEATVRGFFLVTGRDIQVYQNFSVTWHSRIKVRDDLLGSRLIPNVVRNVYTSEYQLLYRINSYGMREKELEDTDQWKILFLGDSMTFGQGVAFGKRFSDLIEKDIDHVYSMNAGVGGYDLHQMYLWFKHYGIDLKPDLVICSVIQASFARIPHRDLEVSKMPHILPPKNVFVAIKKRLGRIAVESHRLLKKRSYLYAFAQARIKVALLWRHLEERDRKSWKKMRKKWKDRDQTLGIDPYDRKAYVLHQASSIFSDFRKLTDEKGIHFLVVNIAATSRGYLEGARLILREIGVDYLDLSNVLRGVREFRFEIDPHYNEKGHAAIAKHLGAYIKEKYGDEIEKKRF